MVSSLAPWHALVDPDSSQASCAHTQSGGMERGGSSFLGHENEYSEQGGSASDIQREDFDEPPPRDPVRQRFVPRRRYHHSGESPSVSEGRPPTSSLGEKAVKGPNNVIVLLSHMQTTCLDVSFASVLVEKHATSGTAHELEFMDKNI